MTTFYARLKDFSNILHLNQMKFVVYDIYILVHNLLNTKVKKYCLL